MSASNQPQAPIPPTPSLSAFRWVVGACCVAMAVSAIYVASLANQMNRRAERLDPLLALLESPDRTAISPPGRTATAGSLPIPTFPSIAVLPIECDARAAQGIAELVPAAVDESLRKHTRFSIVEREKVVDILKQLGDKDRADPAKAGRSLQVSAVLKGRFREHIGPYSWEVELIDVRTGLPVWARTYKFGDEWKNGLAQAMRELPVDLAAFSAGAK